eukprot:Skav205903  [mRNA]  locus=scaffold123:373306:380117:+ [translate_table: standard]
MASGDLTSSHIFLHQSGLEAIERLNSNPAWEAARAALEGSAYQVPEEIYSPVPSTQARLDSVTGSSLTSLGGSDSALDLLKISAQLPEKALFPGARYRFVLQVSDVSNPSRWGRGAQGHPGGLVDAPGVAWPVTPGFRSPPRKSRRHGRRLRHRDHNHVVRGMLGGSAFAEIRLASGPRALLATKDLPAGDITFFVDVYTTWGGSLRATQDVTVDPWPVSSPSAQRTWKSTVGGRMPGHHQWKPMEVFGFALVIAWLCMVTWCI